jgi:hypothetical protein
MLLLDQNYQLFRMVHLVFLKVESYVYILDRQVKAASKVSVNSFIHFAVHNIGHTYSKNKSILV